MNIAVFSDVHGNLLALESFVAATRRQADAYLCLGDIVDYGPWNDECLELIHSLPGIRVVEGNHERLFLGKEDLNHEIPLVQDFFRFSIERFTRPDLIENLPHTAKLGNFVCTHTIGGRSIYPDTEIEVAHDYLIGHSHHQFRIERSGFTIVNPGSIGQNRKWIDMIDFAIVDSDRQAVQMYSLPYDVDLLLSEFRVRGYPERCIQYYATKPRKML